MIDVFN